MSRFQSPLHRGTSFNPVDVVRYLAWDKTGFSPLFIGARRSTETLRARGSHAATGFSPLFIGARRSTARVRRAKSTRWRMETDPPASQGRRLQGIGPLLRNSSPDIRTIVPEFAGR